MSVVFRQCILCGDDEDKYIDLTLYTCSCCNKKDFCESCIEWCYESEYDKENDKEKKP